MARRYFSERPIAGEQVTLDGPEAHHLLHVLRAAPGDEVVLFDGGNDEFDAVVVQSKRTAVELAITCRRTVERELPHPLTLGLALPKGDRQRWIVEKAVELGVGRLVPLVTERSESARADKLHRYVIEASKQCGRNRLMEITTPVPWADWLALPAVDPLGPRRTWVAHPGGRPLAAGDHLHDRPAWIAVGPEGGFTDVEIEDAQAAGWELVGLGPRILRIETAAIALVAALTLGHA